MKKISTIRKLTGQSHVNSHSSLLYYNSFHIYCKTKDFKRSRSVFKPKTASKSIFQTTTPITHAIIRLIRTILVRKSATFSVSVLLLSLIDSAFHGFDSSNKVFNNDFASFTLFLTVSVTPCIPCLVSSNNSYPATWNDNTEYNARCVCRVARPVNTVMIRRINRRRNLGSIKNCK